MKEKWEQLKTAIKKGLIKVIELYNEYIGTYIGKFFHILTHNPVLNVTHSYVILFKRVKFKITNKRRSAFLGYSFILIWLIGYAIFSLYPVFYSLYLSFFKVRPDGQDLNLQWEAFNNYKAAFLNDPFFVEIMIQYVLELVLNVPVVIVFSIVIAMLINQPIKGKGIWRTIFFLPVIITSGPVISELTAQGATTLPNIDDYGMITLILSNVGEFIANPVQSLFDTILLVLWFAGIQILLMLAGLQRIGRSVYEASWIDGAGPWESFWKITLPSLMPLISVSIIYTVVSMSVFPTNEIILYIRNVMLGESTVGTLTTGYGYSAALAWIYFVIMSVIILVFVGLINVRRRGRR
jgi:ABC-type sugar transport system permease subunit